VDLTSVAFADATHGWAVGTDMDYATQIGSGVIISTTDGGATWSPPSSGMTDPLLSVCFSGVDRGWVTAFNYVQQVGSILATRDGGATWTKQNTGATKFLSEVTFTDANHGWAVGSGGSILATTDGGATWKSQSSGTTEYLTAVAFPDASHGWAVSDSGTILVTGDGGGAWGKQHSGTRLELHSVAFADSTHGWVLGGDPQKGGAICLATIDGGATWTERADLAAAKAMCFADALHGWAVGSGGAILATTNGGGPAPDPASQPTVTLSLSGLTVGAVKLGQTVTATGAVAPQSLVGSRVVLSVQMKTGAAWVKVKTTTASSRPVGKYSWKYMPAAKGAYRMRAQLAATGASAAATSSWISFAVK
jgi:photosystem II stability/assembly factor-like uncharacterized protein